MQAPRFVPACVPAISVWLCLLFVQSLTVQAQINYVNIPDVGVDGCCYTDPSITSQASFDIDGDGRDEIRVYAGEYALTSGPVNIWRKMVWVEGGDSTDLAAAPFISGLSGGLGDSLDASPIAFNAGDYVDGAVPLADTAGFLIRLEWNDLGDSSAYGLWRDSLEHALAFRMVDDGLPYYGWIRIEVSEPQLAIVRDYAWNTVPNAPITAGSNVVPVPADRASNIAGADSGDFGDGRDLSFSFDAAADESGVSEYRIMAVPLEDVLAFTVHDANLLTTDRYVSFTPGSPSYAGDFGIAGKDTRGEDFGLIADYRLIVLSVFQAPANVSVLSLPSGTVSLLPSGIQYVDLVPDLVADGCCYTDPANATAVSIDIDGDGTDEVSLKTGEYSLGALTRRQVWVEAIDSAFFAAVPGPGCPGVDSCDWQPVSFNSGDYVDGTLNYTGEAGFLTYFQTDGFDTTELGLWAGGTEAFLGLRFFDDGEDRFGWIRIELPTDHDAVVKDYGWNPFPGEPVVAGSVAVPAAPGRAENLVAADAGDSGTGADLQVSFDWPGDETGILEYRLMAVPLEDVTGFTIADANQVDPSAYVGVTASGSPAYLTDFSGALDTRGEPIVFFRSYRVFALSVATSPSNVNALSASSNTVILTPAGVLVTDIDPDILVDGCCYSDPGSYSEATLDVDGDGIDELAVRAGDYSFPDASIQRLVWLQGLDSTDLAVVAGPGFCPGDSCEFLPIPFLDGDLIDGSIPFDTDGGPLAFLAVSPTDDSLRTGLWPIGAASAIAGFRTVEMGQEYYGWVRIQTPTDHDALLLEFGYNAFAGFPVIAGSADAPAPASRATSIVAADIADLADATDLGIQFEAADDESTVSEYRVMVVPLEDIPTFSISLANLVPAGNYMAVPPSGADVDTFFSASLRDTRGDVITEWRLYQVVVLSMPGGLANASALSAPSNAVSLLPAEGIPTADNIVLQDIGDTQTGDDLGIVFDGAADESHVLTYGLISVKQSASATFNIDSAAALPVEYYWLEAPQGGPISTKLNLSSLDSDGDAITNDQPYVVFIRSFPIPGESLTGTLSEPSGVFMLRDMRVPNLQVEDVADLEDASDLLVSFDHVPFPAGLLRYRIFIVRSDLADNFDLTLASALAPNSHTEINLPVGPDFSIRIDSNQVEAFTQGQIFEGFNYVIFVVSELLPPQFGSDAISVPSNIISLSDNVSSAGDLSQFQPEITLRDQYLHWEMDALWLGSQLEVVEASGRSIVSKQLTSTTGRLFVGTGNRILFVTVAGSPGKAVRAFGQSH